MIAIEDVMAFFGLSALGPQNSFVASRPETYNCTLFATEGKFCLLLLLRSRGVCARGA